MGHKDKAKLEQSSYDDQLRLLQIELVKLQNSLISKGDQILVILEGRDTAGKDGTIKNIVAHLSPRDTRVVALNKPTEREAGEWYFQRYVAELPASGEIVVFNRSWYNRAGVEIVMGFCTEIQYQQFMNTVNEFESLIVGSGIQLIKYYLDIDKEEQAARLESRKTDPLKQWKLSPMDLEARRLWEAYTKAKETMLERTHIPEAPWWVVAANDKKKARLNCITHLLDQIPYKEIDHPVIKLPARVHNPDYLRGPVPPEMYVPEVY